MPKNIVICSDGTGNSTVKGRGTNVFKLFEAVDLQSHQKDPSLCPQIAFYDDGVGTETLKPLKLFGGAFGWGLSRNVKELYGELARVYDPGDRIYLFGFSRGAFTVRTLAALIAQVGIVDRNKVGSDSALKKLVASAYRQHRRCYKRISGSPENDKSAEKQAQDFRFRYSVKDDEHAPGGAVQIEFMGVWDTVDAVGFPLDEIADFWNSFIYPFKFPDTFLSPLVKRACHAIAIDDERYTFHPVMWNERKETAQRIDQVWFAGVHSNVGGGYSKQGVSLVSLVWMMDHAAQSDLRFVPSIRQLYEELQNVNDKVYDSRSGLSAYYRYKPRSMDAICAASFVAPEIHISAVERIAMGTDAYAPGNLSADLVVVGGDRPEVAAALTTAMRTAWRDGSQLLEHAQRWIKLKELFQRAFAFSSVLCIAYLAWRLGVPGLLGLASYRGAVGAMQALGEVPWLCGILAIFFSLSLWSTSQIKQTHSEFWFPLRARLRELLLKVPARTRTAGGR